jgi:DNA-binding transcriptional MerR regulator
MQTQTQEQARTQAARDFQSRGIEYATVAIRHLPEVRTGCGRFSPDEIRELGFTTDIRALGCPAAQFEKILEARAEDARREGRSFRRPAQTDAEIRERAAQLAREIADSDAKIKALEAARTVNVQPLIIPAQIWEP